jgi:hypothetical protein
MRPDVNLEGVLRSSLARAGIVLSYEHVCRKKRCTHQERTPDAALRKCPTHKFKLWPKAVVSPIRFHDLRHTTGSLLMMAGVNPAAVQRILRHHDPRITTEIYGHLEPGYLRAEIDRLRFEPPVVEASDEAIAVANAPPFAASLLQGPPEVPPDASSAQADHAEIHVLAVARHGRFERPTYGSGGRRSIQLS